MPQGLAGLSVEETLVVVPRDQLLREALGDPQRKDVQQRARAVDEKVMQPLRESLGDATQLLVSPDGELNLLPFAALADENGRYLIQRYSFSYLTSGRDLLRMRVAHQSKNKPLVVADPFFGEPPAAQLVQAGQQSRVTATNSRRRSVTSTWPNAGRPGTRTA